MGDGGPPVPQPPPAVPALPAAFPASPTQPAAPPVQPDAQPAQLGPVPQLNWSHFKLQFAGKADKDVEAHLLRTNDSMDTHVFTEGVKVQRFCLTLVGEARLWYESLRSTALDWYGLQTQLR